MNLRVLLIKEVADIAEGEALYAQLKALIAPAEPIIKDGSVIQNHKLD